MRFGCNRCNGEGEIMVCPDDLCRGSGECFGGSRYRGCFVPCPDCGGEGVSEEEDDLDYIERIREADEQAALMGEDIIGFKTRGYS